MYAVDANLWATLIAVARILAASGDRRRRRDLFAALDDERLVAEAPADRCHISGRILMRTDNSSSMIIGNLAFLLSRPGAPPSHPGKHLQPVHRRHARFVQKLSVRRVRPARLSGQTFADHPRTLKVASRRRLPLTASATEEVDTSAMASTLSTSNHWRAIRGTGTTGHMCRWREQCLGWTRWRGRNQRGWRLRCTMRWLVGGIRPMQRGTILPSTIRWEWLTPKFSPTLQLGRPGAYRRDGALWPEPTSCLRCSYW